MMKPPENETAVPGFGSRNGGEAENALAGAFLPHKYRSPRFASMPSAEKVGKVALVVARGDRLFAVGAYATGGAQ